MALDSLTIASVAAFIASLYGIAFFADSLKAKIIPIAFWPTVAAQCLLLLSIIVTHYDDGYGAMVLIAGVLALIGSILIIAYEVTRQKRMEVKERIRMNAAIRKVISNPN